MKAASPIPRPLAVPSAAAGDLRTAGMPGSGSAIVAVLAGGRGRRIGGAKPMRSLAGRPLIEYPLAAARKANIETIVVAKAATQLPDGLTAHVVLEPDEPHHPLTGAVAALEYATRVSASAVVMVGCDMPLVTAALLAWIAEMPGGALLLELDGRTQPLPTRCLPRHAPLLREALEREAPLREALGALAPAILDERALARFGEARRLCFSVNSAEDLAAAERWLPLAEPAPDRDAEPG
ncbi:MAG TPA: NTP transferase domain-containing protein [Solirubrobacteraceae bacterium]|jgi:molybdopterin-guanine dinucleotide biosynthesis protein A|nr:NTP transferase domain-containing protein [Solirubrobacteraceae bacterium]